MPTPGSPQTTTVCPWPVRTFSKRSHSVASSSLRPTSRVPGSMGVCAVSTSTPITSKAWICWLTPFSGGTPRSASRNRSSIRRPVASLMTTDPGAAMASSRDAMFGVLPNTDVSDRSELPISPTRAAPGMDAHPRRQAHARGGQQLGVEPLEARHHGEAGADGTLGIVLVSRGVPEVRQEPVAEVLGDVPAEARHHRPAHLLVGQDQLATVLGIERLGQLGGADQVAEHHRQVTPLAAVGREVAHRDPTACGRWHHPRDLHQLGAAQGTEAGVGPGHLTAGGARQGQVGATGAATRLTRLIFVPAMTATHLLPPMEWVRREYEQYMTVTYRRGCRFLARSPAPPHGGLRATPR